jgi:hypothetical protein
MPANKVEESVPISQFNEGVPHYARLENRNNQINQNVIPRISPENIYNNDVNQQYDFINTRTQCNPNYNNKFNNNNTNLKSYQDQNQNQNQNFNRNNNSKHHQGKGKNSNYKSGNYQNQMLNQNKFDNTNFSNPGYTNYNNLYNMNQFQNQAYQMGYPGMEMGNYCQDPRFYQQLPPNYPNPNFVQYEQYANQMLGNMQGYPINNKMYAPMPYNTQDIGGSQNGVYPNNMYNFGVNNQQDGNNMRK